MDSGWNGGAIVLQFTVNDKGTSSYNLISHGVIRGIRFLEAKSKVTLEMTSTCAKRTVRWMWCELVAPG